MLVQRNTKLAEAAVAEIGSMQHPRLSLKDSRFTLETPEASQPWPNLNIPVIIVGVNPHKSKIYYASGYDAANTGPPTCWSDNGVAPSINAEHKQCRSCAECPHNAWNTGGGITGKGKACADKKKVAVIVLGDPAREVYELAIPPASLNNWSKYVGSVCSKNTPDGSRKADLFDVVTVLTQKDKILEFQNFCWVDCIDEEDNWHQNGAPDDGVAIAARLDALIESDAVVELVGMNDKPWSGNYHGEVLEPAKMPEGATGMKLLYPATQAVSGSPGASRIPVNEFVTPPATQANSGHSPTPFSGPPGVPVSQPQASPDPQPVRIGRPPGSKNKPKTILPAPKEALQQAPMDIPPFLNRTPQGSFGVTSAPPPSPGIADAVRAAFNMKQ